MATQNIYLPDTDDSRLATVWKPEFGTPAAEVCVPPNVAIEYTTADDETFNFSVAGDGTTPFEYAWDFGDGNTSTEATPSNTYSVSGTYLVTLVINNDCGSANIFVEVIAEVITPIALPAFDYGYAHARLSLDYTGPLLRVQNQTTDVQTDIPYDSNNLLDLVALAACAAAGQVLTVHTWYDQGAGGYDLIQTDKTKQAVIWTADAYVGFTLADGTNDYYVTSSIPVNSAQFSVITDGREQVVFTNNTCNWRLSSPFYHSYADGASNRTLYGSDLDDYVAVDNQNTADATRISMIDMSLNLNASFENTVYADGVLQTESYTQGNAYNPGMSSGPLYLFSLNGSTAFADSKLRAWIGCARLLNDAERVLFDAFTYAPAP